MTTLVEDDEEIWCTRVRYYLQHPEKYRRGQEVIHLKSYMDGFMVKELDNNPSVLEWDYESVAIPYRNPYLENGVYLMDFEVITHKKTYWIELRMTKDVLNPSELDKAKWREARRYADVMGAQFLVFPEHSASFIQYNERNKEGLEPIF